MRGRERTGDPNPPRPACLPSPVGDPNPPGVEFRWPGCRRSLPAMCALRLILVFLSTALAGYFAWKTVR
ncbi:hypothetical protein COCNU_03G004080 [Cocos nucifera]|uniref:Uncharacterized protein n=1 Tax=Cocos nucifera TaxID=13894 RepID=A0A8K0MYE6_COCNU|nr:hypothetical protein COCNU_03G004080 [Cocos nucifera]